MRLLNYVINTYLRKTNPVKWARRLGVSVGEGCFISPDTDFPSEPYLVTIGNHVQITAGVTIHTHGGANVIRRDVPDFDCFGKVTIEDWAYVGSGARIMPGVTIGEGALVGAGSVVTRSVEPGSVVAGNPARFICSVADYAERNMEFNTRTKGLSESEKKSVLLAMPEDKFIKK